MAETTTTRAQVHRWSAETDTPSRDEFDTSFGNIELYMVGYQRGTLALRPAPGKFGWFYQDQPADHPSGQAHVYWDTGTAWMDLTMEYGVTADIVASHPGDTADGGSTGMPADAGHRHAREGFGAAVPSIRFAIAKADGASGSVARADHVHGTPTLQNNGVAVTSRAALSFVGLLVSDDAAGDRTVVTLPLADALPAAETIGGAGQVGVSTDAAREDHAHAISRTLASYNEQFHTVTATTATTTLDASTSVNKKVTLQANTTLAVANVPTGVIFAITVTAIQDGVGGRTLGHPAGTRWPHGTPPVLPNGANARNVLQYVTDDGGTTWDGYFIGPDLR